MSVSLSNGSSESIGRFYRLKRGMRKIAESRNRPTYKLRQLFPVAVVSGWTVVAQRVGTAWIIVQQMAH